MYMFQGTYISFYKIQNDKIDKIQNVYTIRNIDDFLPF